MLLEIGRNALGLLAVGAIVVILNILTGPWDDDSGFRP